MVDSDFQEGEFDDEEFDLLGPLPPLYKQMQEDMYEEARQNGSISLTKKGSAAKFQVVSNDKKIHSDFRVSKDGQVLFVLDVGGKQDYKLFKNAELVDLPKVDQIILTGGTPEEKRSVNVNDSFTRL